MVTMPYIVAVSGITEHIGYPSVLSPAIHPLCSALGYSRRERFHCCDLMLGTVAAGLELLFCPRERVEVQRKRHRFIPDSGNSGSSGPAVAGSYFSVWLSGPLLFKVVEIGLASLERAISQALPNQRGIRRVEMPWCLV